MPAVARERALASERAGNRAGEQAPVNQQDDPEDSADDDELDTDGSDEAFEVERILDYMIFDTFKGLPEPYPQDQDRFQVLYQVKWLGYPDSENSLEPKSSFVDEKSWEAFWKECEQTKPPRESHANLVAQAEAQNKAYENKRNKILKRKEQADADKKTKKAAKNKSKRESKRPESDASGSITAAPTRRSLRDPPVTVSNKRRRSDSSDQQMRETRSNRHERIDQAVLNDLIGTSRHKMLRELRISSPPQHVEHLDSDEDENKVEEQEEPSSNHKSPLDQGPNGLKQSPKPDSGLLMDQNPYRGFAHDSESEEEEGDATLKNRPPSPPTQVTQPVDKGFASDESDEEEADSKSANGGADHHDAAQVDLEDGKVATEEKGFRQPEPLKPVPGGFADDSEDDSDDEQHVTQQTAMPKTVQGKDARDPQSRNSKPLRPATKGAEEDSGADAEKDEHSKQALATPKLAVRAVNARARAEAIVDSSPEQPLMNLRARLASTSEVSNSPKGFKDESGASPDDQAEAILRPDSAPSVSEGRSMGHAQQNSTSATSEPVLPADVEMRDVSGIPTRTGQPIAHPPESDRDVNVKQESPPISPEGALEPNNTRDKGDKPPKSTASLAGPNGKRLHGEVKGLKAETILELESPGSGRQPRTGGSTATDQSKTPEREGAKEKESNTGDPESRRQKDNSSAPKSSAQDKGDDVGKTKQVPPASTSTKTAPISVPAPRSPKRTLPGADHVSPVSAKRRKTEKRQQQASAKTPPAAAPAPAHASPKAIAQRAALKKFKIGRLPREGAVPIPPIAPTPISPPAVPNSPDLLSNSHSSSGTNSKKREQDPFNYGVQRPSAKDGYIRYNVDTPAYKGLPDAITGREKPKWSHEVPDNMRIRSWWGIDGNPIDNFVNFDKVLSHREVYITPRPTPSEVGINKRASVHDKEYLALQLVLAHIKEVKQVDSLRDSVTAVFVHASFSNDLGRFPGKLSELDHWRDREDVVFFWYGSDGNGKRQKLCQFWKPLTAITFTSSALLRDPVRLSRILENAAESRDRVFRARDQFPFMLSQYLLTGGTLGPSEPGKPSTSNPQSEARQPAIDAVMSLLHAGSLTLTRIAPRLGPPYRDQKRFPAHDDSVANDPVAWSRLSQCYLPKYCQVSPERLQNLVCSWRTRYTNIRRWIIIATREEKTSLAAAPGILLVTATEAERIIQRPLKVIFG
ncbi:uncharacterized protein JCM15063_005046 [Sporobolomyces koalae]|uniref:uncharacterized protein n=1 Tax=Sporobolomyces koalae TaxID=500713 RepID=UPI0031827770